MGLLDIVFPKFCVQCRKIGDYICADCFVKIAFIDHQMCLPCNKAAIDGRTHPVCRKTHTIDGALASVTYTGVIKKLVYQFKYAPYIKDLSGALSDLMYEGLIQQEQFHRILNESILVPIPLYKERHRERGYNQAELLAKNIAKRMGLQVKPLLKREKRTHIQADLPREKRQENMKNAFTLASLELATFNKKQVILVDDIITTGTTMLEAAKVIKKAGVEKVWGIALAHGK